jgi:hypothetical protein
MATRRPTIHNEEVVGLAARNLVAKAVREDANLEGREDDFLVGVSHAIQYNDDGYDICRSLESDGWEPDAKLVEIMDQAIFEKMEALSTAEQVWAAKEKIVMRFGVREAVTFADRTGAWQRGVILSVDERRAKYTVFCEALGHVPQGQSGVSGVILNEEECSAAEGV